MILAWTGDELSRGQALDWCTHRRTHRQTDAGNDNTRRPKLDSGKNDQTKTATIWVTNWHSYISSIITTESNWCLTKNVWEPKPAFIWWSFFILIYQVLLISIFRRCCLNPSGAIDFSRSMFFSHRYDCPHRISLQNHRLNTFAPGNSAFICSGNKSRMRKMNKKDNHILIIEKSLCRVMQICMSSAKCWQLRSGPAS